MEELKKYEEPEMEIKFIDWSDIVTESFDPSNEPYQGVVTLPGAGSDNGNQSDPWDD